MGSKHSDQYFTPKEVARMLNINYEMVLSLIHLGKLNSFRIGRQFRISMLELREFLESNRYKSHWKGEIK